MKQLLFALAVIGAASPTQARDQTTQQKAFELVQKLDEAIFTCSTVRAHNAATPNTPDDPSCNTIAELGLALLGLGYCTGSDWSDHYWRQGTANANGHCVE